MRLKTRTVTVTQLVCSKGGGDEVRELLPCTSTIRDWDKPQGSATFPLLVPQQSREEILGLEVPRLAIGPGASPPEQ